MDINNHHELLLAELIESYARLRTELERFEGIGDTIIRFSISNPHPNDEKLSQTHWVKSQYLETELKNKKNELSKNCQPFRVCTDVYGYKYHSFKSKSKEVLILVKYGNNVAYEYYFKDGKIDQICKCGDETVNERHKDLYCAREICTAMTNEELAEYGFIVGKPPLNKQIK